MTRLDSISNPGAAAIAVPARALPPLPRRGESRDDLAPWQRRAMVGAILVAHGAAVWGLMQVREVREAIAEAAPMFVSLVAPEKPPLPEPPPPPPPVPRPVPKRPPPPAPVIAAAPVPTPAPAAFVVPEPPPVVPEPPPPVVAEAPPAPLRAPEPAPAAPPKVIPASAVQYLEPIALEYPRLSKRAGETGRVMIRVYIDEAGLAQNVQVYRSSAHVRLDDAALAAVQKARFKPYTENGRPVAGWAFIPIEFELEK